MQSGDDLCRSLSTRIEKSHFGVAPRSAIMIIFQIIGGARSTIIARDYPSKLSIE
jgi:hypothetical protein